MAKIRRSVALVVEKFAASDVRLLLIVDKKWHIGIFSQCVLPGVGSVIDIEWRYSPATNEITVLSWKKYTGYEPMDRFTVNNTGSATEFTGFFYTTGCVRYNGFPLENPAIFNNYIGIVFDKSKVLNENYIGKLKATVTFAEVDGIYCWTLCRVDRYFKKETAEVRCLHFISD